MEEQTSNQAIEDTAVVRIQQRQLVDDAATVSINLPTGESFVFRTMKRERVRGGPRLLWTGEAEAVVGRATMVVDGTDVTGRFNIGSRYFSLIPLNGSFHALIELDVARLDEKGRDAICPNDLEECGYQPTEANGAALSGDNFTTMSAPTVRVLVAASNDVAGTISSIASTADIFANDLEDVLSNSGTSGDAQVVLTRDAFRINYDESTGNFDDETHLNLLRGTSDGSMDSIHELRDYDKADIVALLIDDGPNCGIAHKNPAADHAFMVVDIHCTNFTFARWR